VILAVSSSSTGWQGGIHTFTLIILLGGAQFLIFLQMDNFHLQGRN